MSLKKRGNARLLKLIGDEILDNILSTRELESIHNLVDKTLTKHLDVTDIDKVTITETYRLP
jgi:hypothetical protein